MEIKFEKIRCLIIMLFSGIMLSAVVILINPAAVRASSGTVSMYTKESSYIVGDKVKLVVDVNSTAGISFVDMEIMYDDTLLEFISGDEGVSAYDGLIRISDHFSKNKNRKKYTISFTALSAGSWEFLTSTEPMVYDASFEVMSLSTLRTTVVIENEAQEKKEAALSYLRVAQGELSPEFSSDIKEYEVTVSNDVRNVTVYADSAEDSHQVSIDGSDNLIEGNNRVVISVGVKGENEALYILTVHRNTLEEDAAIREAENGEDNEGISGEGENTEKDGKSGNEGEDESGENEEKGSDGTGTDDEGILTIEGGEGIMAQKVNGKLELILSQKFTMVPLPEDVVVPSGYEKTQLILDGNSLTAYTLSDDLENDFLLFYGKLRGGEEGFYFYDRKEQTLQRYSGNPYLHTDRNITVMDENAYEQKLSSLRIALGVFIGLFVIALIACLTLVIQKKEQEELDKL